MGRVNDGVDNDGDGVVDEKECGEFDCKNSIDDDADVLVDEMTYILKVAGPDGKNTHLDDFICIESNIDAE